MGLKAAETRQTNKEGAFFCYSFHAHVLQISSRAEQVRAFEARVAAVLDRALVPARAAASRSSTNTLLAIALTANTQHCHSFY